MLENLKKLNPEIEFFDVTDKEFATFGRIVTSIDTTEIIETAKQIQNPESGSAYVPSCEAFEKLRIAKEIGDLCYGTMPSQVGYCWGHNTLMNATEWHSAGEINIAVTPLVLILGHIWDIENGKIDSSKFKAFFLPAGTAVEVYSSTLHYCPCEVSESGFGCVVGLPEGTNTELDYNTDDKLLYRKNKWIICHSEHEELINDGVTPAITGTNFEIKY